MNLNEEISEEFYFKLADGRVIKSVPEMIEAIRSMDEWVYRHHVNTEKNDFANWIQFIYNK